ncbi:unnamed protein product [Microthlaspi erraticum]|uniref:DUF1985 domain-containing protein n=1 Tax=Microthlaspi erraticum TaxID=1685480 RepID=A0A6D2I8Q0_9BRAS|nr:unnamed protein product [Microthlaspi erraticum]
MDSELPKILHAEGAEPLSDKINKCARMSILTDLAKGVKSEYAEVKRDPLFAKIIAIHENRLHFSAKLVHSFMTRQLVTAKKHELWFVFARRPLRFSLQEFHAVTGLKCQDDGKSDQIKWVEDGGFWSTMFKTRGNISFETIDRGIRSSPFLSLILQVHRSEVVNGYRTQGPDCTLQVMSLRTS